MKLDTFTKREIAVIQSMACIAEALGMSEGDYQGFTAADWRAVESILEKIAEKHREDQNVRASNHNGATSRDCSV